MIKTGIAGAQNQTAGELLRILVNHPDVVVQAVESRPNTGLSVTAVHHGLIGETPLFFQPALDPSKLDVVFVCDPEADVTLPMLTHHYPGLRVVDLTWRHSLHPDDDDTVYGLSEIFRKPMVRGSMSAAVPRPLASIALIALYPLAAHSALPGELLLHCEAPADLCTPAVLEQSAAEIEARLSELEQANGCEVRIEATPTGHHRATRVTLSVPCSLPIEEVQRMYESIYDDHNFTFMVGSPTDTREVSGTHKCIVSLRKTTPATLEVDALADCRMRGGAGEAVHAMNLLFGLHEKVGLSLKAAKY